MIKNLIRRYPGLIGSNNKPTEKLYWIVLQEIGEAGHNTFLGEDVKPIHTAGWYKCLEVYGEHYHDGC